ncbi:S-layer homology domain-containing protein [Lachnoanaerobaculum sp. Marseille-Q4761]|uniref:S-layer homology domain-containing protein n=1 Tax=Lachnoanaerobaculum sp. Marseille-Q4761 TaxID=2819511 RepID=UPI001FB7D001|nr:S-layer homology domain-containing protein [Lachnoanaerobaculum sp. Marseille-Q4761]
MSIKKAIKFTLLLSIAICFQLFLIAPSVKAEQKTYTDNEVNISKKDLIIFLEKLSGNLESDLADIGNSANVDEEYIKNSVKKLKELNIIDEHVSFDNLYESPKKEEVYYILAKYIGVEAADGKTAFNDDEKLQSWSRGYIKELENLGVIDGKDKSFEPDKVLNRGELRDVNKELFLAVINTSQSFRADENNKSKAFIVVNANDALIENVKTQTPILINAKASNGRLRIINSDISKIYIAGGSQNFEVQLSNSKLQSAKSLGKNISYTNLGPDGKVGPLPNPEEYKPGDKRVVTKIIKSSKSHSSSSSSSGNNNQKENKSQSDKEAEEKGRTQDKDNPKKNAEGSGSANKKTPQENSPSEDKSKSGGGSSTANKKAPQESSPSEGKNKSGEGNGTANKKAPQENSPSEDKNKTGEGNGTANKKTPQEGKTSGSKNKTGESNIGNPGNKAKDNKKELLPKENETVPNESSEDKALENASEDFIILNEHLYADKTLKYKALDGVNLEDNALIGLKLSGENNGVKLNIKWEGKSLEQVKNAQKGEYQLAVSSLEDLVINNNNYGKVKFIVKIIIE